MERERGKGYGFAGFAPHLFLHADFICITCNRLCSQINELMMIYQRRGGRAATDQVPGELLIL